MGVGCVRYTDSILLFLLLLTLHATHNAITVFKTNTSYQRWDEARKAWETVKNNSRSIARQTTAWVYHSDNNQLTDEEKYRLIRRVADALWLFPRTLQTHLLHPVEDQDAYRRDIRARVEHRPLAEECVACCNTTWVGLVCPLVFRVKTNNLYLFAALLVG